jgi:FAD/FMN-containing dehydrogenase
VRLCRHYDVPVTARGGGTSLAGNSCNVAVIIDTSKYLHHIIEIDSAAKTALVQPGCVLDFLRDAAEAHHLTFGPDPATHDHNSLGGMIGNNSCGPHSIMAGRTADNVEALEILTYDGERFWVGATSDEALERIIEAGGRRGEIHARLKTLRERYAEDIRSGYRDIPRRVSGYNLPQLLPENGCNIARALVGTEGTCVFVLQAKLRLIHSPSKRALVVLGFADIYRAGDAVPSVLEHEPLAIEGLDDRLIVLVKKKQMQEAAHLDLLPEGNGWLLVELGADDQEALQRQVDALVEAAKGFEGGCDVRPLLDKDEQESMWKIRETGLAATAHVPDAPDTWPGWEDAAVPPEKVGAYLREFRALLDRYDYECSLYGHFGDGCIHVRIDFDLYSEHS